MKPQAKKIIFIALLLVLAGISVFAFIHKKAEDKKGMTEVSLKAQAQKYWEARLNGDYKTIYSIVDSQYKSKVTEQQFTSTAPDIIKSYEILDAKVDAEKHSGKTRSKFKTIQMGFELEPEVTELWLYEGNEWHINYTATSNPFASANK